ncbi:MAG: ABC transporter substrate-binding protein [Actinomycetota bacterium]
MGGTRELTMYAEHFSPTVEGDHYVSLDPAIETTTEGLELLRCCLTRTLMAYGSGPDGAVRVMPDLAGGTPTISDDGLTWTFRLRGGLRYAPPLEGVAITSDDFVRALERAARQPVTAPYPNYFTPISGYEAVRAGDATMISGLATPDDRTLIIHLTRATGDLADRLALPTASPLPAAAADLLHDDEAQVQSYGEFLVSSGPYMFEGSSAERLDPAAPAPGAALSSPRSITLVRNPSWDPASDPIRSAYVDRIHISVGGDATSNSALVESGAVDLQLEVSTPVPRALLRRYEDDPSLVDRIVTWDLASQWAVSMNLAMPPFDDLHVRRAVAFATNTRALVRVLRTVPGYRGTAATGRLARHVAPDATEADLLTSFDPFPGKVGAERRTRAAVEMTRSRYDTDGDGRCGAPVCADVPIYSFDSPVARVVLDTLRKDLHPIGIELVPTFDDAKTYSIFTGQLRAPIFGTLNWAADYPNASTFFLPMLAGDAIRPGLSMNHSMLGASPSTLRRLGYEVRSVPSIDDRIAACVPLTGEEQTACWALLDKYVMSKVVPWVPYFTDTFVSIVSPRVRNVVPDPLTQAPALDQVWLADGPGGVG